MISSSYIRRSLLIFPLAIPFISCSDKEVPPRPADPSTSSASSTPVRGETLVVAAMSDYDALMPPTYLAAATGDVVQQIFPQPFDMVWKEGLEVKPRAVEKWEWNPAHTELTLHFRPGMTWGDGQPITAHDYLFSWDLIRDPATGSSRREYSEFLDPAKGVVAIDDLTARLTFTQAYDEAAMMGHAAITGILPRHILKDAQRSALRGHDFGFAPLAGGPFRVTRYVRNQQLTLERNEAVRETNAPFLNRVVFKIIPEYTSRIQELENGSVDMVEQVSVEDYARLKKSHPELNFKTRGWKPVEYITWNMEDPLFADVKVRTALALAVNIDELMKTLLATPERVFARRAVSTLTPELKAFFNDAITPLPFDPGKARTLLQEAGYRDTNGDGVVEKNGVPLSFRLDTNAGNARRAKAGVLLQKMWKAVGVKVELQQVETNAFFGSLRDHKYQAGLTGWTSRAWMDPRGEFGCATPTLKRPFNSSGFCDPSLDSLIQGALTEVDRSKSAPQWKEIQARIYAAQPYLFLYWREEIVAIHRRFQNVQTGFMSTFDHLYQWHVPTGEQKRPH